MREGHDLDTVWWTLRLTYGLVPIVAGLDKLTNLLVDWSQYLSPLVERALPIPASTFMLLVGGIEIAAGVFVLARPRVGAYVVSAWLAAIAISLLTTGRYFDVAVRDVVMGIGAFALARLSEARTRRDVEAPGRRETFSQRAPAAV